MNNVYGIWDQCSAIERPQKGRYRQFHQAGVEVFGIATPEIDAELIILTARLWKAFRY